MAPAIASSIPIDTAASTEIGSITVKKQILIFGAVMALGMSRAIAQEMAHSHHCAADGQDYRAAKEQDHETKLRYTCPMHPEVVMDHPGTCPKCGMRLVLARKEKDKPAEANHSTDAPHSAHETEMRSSVNLADPMARESSGTAWVPDSTPVYGTMFMIGDSMLMLHGAIFPRYVNVGTPRGDDRIDAPNWIMGMFAHPLGDSTQLGLRLMMSLDPLTEGGRGYPLLFQSGESWHDQPLHDRQHPHDLLDELSLSISHQLGAGLSGYFYFGYPGEPALGPPTFMHRVSAMDNPDAPIGHHWQDSTHVTFGVATAGLQWRSIKVEGSAFTGREPDDNRYDFDRPRFDSFSGRVSWNPTPNVALQVSHGYIKSPEALEPDVDRHRTTASAIYNQPLGRESNWAATFVWGRNNDESTGSLPVGTGHSAAATTSEKTESFLLEADYQHRRDIVYARWERVEKSGHELVLARADLDKIFPINAASIGYVRDLSRGRGIDLGLGGQVTVNFWRNELDRYYGGSPGYEFEIFLRIRPSLYGEGAMHQSEALK